MLRRTGQADSLPVRCVVMHHAPVATATRNELAGVDSTIIGWLLTALPNDEREYIGNQGYDDVISEAYHYDNKVQNSKRIKVGDVAVLRSTRMEGIARIARIHEQQGVKTLLVCPECARASRIKARATLTPKYRCFKCEATFDEPNTKDIDVTKFSAHFDGTFVAMPDALSIQTLRECCVAYNPQLAMQRVDLKRLIGMLAHEYPEARGFLAETDPHLREMDMQIERAADALQAEGEFDPNGEGDARIRMLRTIAARAGQGEFRKQLLRAYSNQCAMTGCQVEQVLEAAHIVPYNGARTNHIANGLLLRADVHTLFDRGLLVIDAEMRIDVHVSLRGSMYGELHGKHLRMPNAKLSYPSRKALAVHRAQHRGGKTR